MAMQCSQKSGGKFGNQPVYCDKGKQGCRCNVTHCQKPDSAFFFNTATNAWYCECCARKIEEQARLDGMSFFPELKDVPVDDRRS